jgi:hypothetical protein
MTIDDIPPKLRQPGFIVFNGQETHVKLTEKQGDDLAFMTELDKDKGKSA